MDNELTVMKFLKSKFIRKVGILGFSLTIAIVSILIINTKYNLLSQVIGALPNSPLFIDNKFCDIPSTQAGCTSFIPSALAADAASLYQSVAGPVNISGLVDTAGTIRSTSQTIPLAGSGLELVFSNGAGYLTAYNRSSSAYLPLYLSGSTITLNAAGGVGISGNIKATGSVAGGQTSNGWVLGKGAWGPDTWLRLTTTEAGTTYHDFAAGKLYSTSVPGGIVQSDLAEVTPSSENDHLQQGEIVVIDKQHGTKITRSAKPYDRTVYGIVSSYEQAAMIIGADVAPGAGNKTKDRTPIALIGRVKTKVSAENGPIEVGDLLTTSSTPGHAMKCSDFSKCFGAIVGKALEPLNTGTGKILVLATLQ